MERKSKPSRVCFIGQPYWTGRLCKLMQRYASDLVDPVAVCLPGDNFAKIWREVVHSCITVRVGFRPGARTVRGIAFDLLFDSLMRAAPGTQACNYWIGTDLSNAVADWHRGRSTRYFEKSRSQIHIASAPWFAEELLDMAIRTDATIVFPEDLPGQEPIPPMPALFSVLSYVPDSRYLFYGGDQVFEIARELPQVQFHIVGGKGEWVRRPLPNLAFHGWVSDLKLMFWNASVVLRIVEHDGVGNMVRQALAYGRHVFYTYNIPWGEHVQFGDIEGFKCKILEYLERHQSGRLAPNQGGYEYVFREWGERKLCRELGEYLRLKCQDIR